jgi:hypothetical protein
MIARTPSDASAAQIQAEGVALTDNLTRHPSGHQDALRITAGLP